MLIFNRHLLVKNGLKQLVWWLVNQPFIQPVNKFVSVLSEQESSMTTWRETASVISRMVCPMSSVSSVTTKRFLGNTARWCTVTSLITWSGFVTTTQTLRTLYTIVRLRPRKTGTVTERASGRYVLCFSKLYMFTCTQSIVQEYKKDDWT